MKTNNPSSFPKLTTERLLLRRLEETDELAIFLLRTDESVNRYIQRDRFTSNKEAHAFIKKIQNKSDNDKSIFWAISQKDTKSLIGTICLWNFSQDKNKAEFGYEMNPLFQGKGLMSEAVKCVLEYGFMSLGLKIIEAYTHRKNEASKRLLKKHFFILQEDRTDEDNADNIIFSLEKEA